MTIPLTWLAITIDVDPVAFSIGPASVRWYGLAYVVAIIVGIQFARPFAERRGISRDAFDTASMVCAAAGFAGGRLYYVVQNDPSDYLADPVRILQVWNGGMAYFGAIFAVTAAVAVLAWRRLFPLGAALDAGALFALIGQPIGRLGNVANGDILGPPSALPWAVVYPHPDSFAPSSTASYHPAMFYEIIANLVLIAALWPVRGRLRNGWFATAYMALYSVSQLVVFIWRSEPTLALGLRQGQWTALALLAGTAIVATFRFRAGRRIESQNAPSAP